jgi:hypothetical protein
MKGKDSLDFQRLPDMMANRKRTPVTVRREAVRVAGRRALSLMQWR